MQFSHRLVVAVLVSLVAACGGESAEPPAAATATEGSEAPPAATPAPVEAEPAHPPAPPAETAEPAPPAAQPAQPPEPQMPPFAAVLIQEVKDFDAWKQGFDGSLEQRKQAGAIGEGVMRGADNDKLVVVYLPGTDAEQLKGYFASKELKDATKAAVKGKSTVLVFQHDSARMAPPDRTDLYSAIVQYKVKDYVAFKTALEGGDEARSAAGILGYGLSKPVDEKAGEAYVYLQSDDAAKLKGYLDAKETKQAMKDAGVKGQPKVTIVQEGAITLYPQ